MDDAAFISGDAILIAYDTPVFDRDRSTHFTLSAGRIFWEGLLEAKLSGVYSQDPYFDEDIGAVLIDGSLNPASCFRCHGSPKTTRGCAPCHG
jgi:hypothetical protein